MKTDAHKSVAQDYYLDALDLHSRFRAHWEEQTRKSSRVKSFIDLLMACECMLKSQCIMERKSLPIAEAYAEVKALGHNIDKLSRSIKHQPTALIYTKARCHFSPFHVRLRYSVDANEYFFPILGVQSSGRPTYSETLGNSAWMEAAEDVVKELLEWGKTVFCGEVTNDIETILNDYAAIEIAIHPPPFQAKKKVGKN